MYPTNFGGQQDKLFSIQPFIIEKVLSMMQKIIIASAASATALIIGLISFIIYKKMKHSRNVGRYRRRR